MVLCGSCMSAPLATRLATRLAAPSIVFEAEYYSDVVEDVGRAGSAEQSRYASWTDLPLHFAARDGDLDEVRRLSQSPEVVSVRDSDGFTALHFAAMESQAEVVSILVAVGAEVDARDRWGNTPLWRAVFNSRGHGETVLALLAAGADPDLANKSGVSPRALADKIANYDVRQFFESTPRL